MSQVQVEVGSFWKEDTEKYERYIKVLEIDGSFARIKTCNEFGEIVNPKEGGCYLGRFGIPGGFVLFTPKERKRVTNQGIVRHARGGNHDSGPPNIIA